jgi:hypothetical protein
MSRTNGPATNGGSNPGPSAGTQIFGNGVDVSDPRFTALFSGGPGTGYGNATQNTYQLVHDGTNINHYLNGIMMNPPIANTRPGPWYAYVNVPTPNTIVTLTMFYAPTTTFTGPIANNILYKYGSAIRIDQSTGNYIITKPVPSSNTGFIYSTTPINGPFTLSFIFSNVDSTTGNIANMFGITSTASAVAAGTATGNATYLSHGLMNWGGAFWIFANSTSTAGPIASATNISVPTQYTTGTGTTYTYTMTYDGTYMTHYMNGVRIIPPVICTSITPTTPAYVYVNIAGNANNSISGPLAIRFDNTPAPTGPTGIFGPTGPISNPMKYTYSNVTINQSDGSYMLSGTTNAFIYSTTPMYGPFNITFTFNNLTDLNKQQIIGVTPYPGNMISMTNAATPAVNLTHGINNKSSDRAFYVNGTNKGPAAQAIPAAPGTDTKYTIRFDGTTFRHYINDVIYPGNTTSTPPAPGEYINVSTLPSGSPFYVYAYIDGGSASSLAISYTPVGPVGPTGPPVSNVMQFTYSPSVTVDKSTGAFLMPKGYGTIISNTAVSGAFNLTFSFVNVASMSSFQSMGLLQMSPNGPVPPVDSNTLYPSHGIFSNGGFYAWVIGGVGAQNINFTTLGLQAAWATSTSTPQTVTIISDGTFYTFYAASRQIGPPWKIPNPLPYPLYPMFCVNSNVTPNILGPIYINYTPYLPAPTGFTGSTGPEGKTVLPVNTSFVFTTGNGGTITPGNVPAGYGGTALLVSPLAPTAAPAGSTTFAANQLIKVTGISSVTSPLLLFTTNQQYIGNTTLSPMSVDINMSYASGTAIAASNQPPQPTIHSAYVNIYSILQPVFGNAPIFTSGPMPVIGFSYSFVLPIGYSFIIAYGYISPLLIGSSPATTPQSIIVSITQTQLAAGGGRPRIVDVAPAVKPKLRKSSIRIKKAKKQTAKSKK